MRGPLRAFAAAGADAVVLVPSAPRSHDEIEALGGDLLPLLA